MPIEQKGKKRLWEPIVAGPWMATWEINSQFSPSCTAAPTTQYGPTEHEAGMFAVGSMTAVAWIMLDWVIE
jgi:hypothetical protein